MVKLSEVSSFITNISPFNSLPKEAIGELVAQFSINTIPKGDTLPCQGIIEPRLYVVRRGSLSCVKHDGELISRLGEGDLCTAFCTQIIPLADPSQAKVEQQVRADEDSIVYSVRCEVIKALAEQYPSISDYFSHLGSKVFKQKISKVYEEAIIASTLMNNTVSDFYNKSLVGIDASQNIQQAAIKMTEQNYSCLVVFDNKNLVGIVTDKDIRRRCVAVDLPITANISEIMSVNISTIDINNDAYDALITMTSKGIGHLPVTSQGEVVGMVTVTDILNNESHNSVNFTSIIQKAHSVTELVEITALIPKLQVRLAKLGANADHVGKTISAITIALTKRLIDMAEDKYGPSPVPYAWIACGSQGRKEQLAHSDQDNGMIICDSMKPEDDAWFEQVANFVCDGLDKCGFIYCPGDIMASNPKWRQPAKVWQQYFNSWVDTPNPKALLHSTVFFDLATICGDVSLLQSVRENLLKKTKDNSLFIAYLSKNALELRPPLGFFRDFVLKQTGKHKETIDLKHNGIAPIVDLARIYALSQGISAVNTIERIKQAAGTAAVSASSAKSLLDAYDFLSTLRLKHQANLMMQGLEADNYLSPKELSDLERMYLKDAFKVIKTLQDSRQTSF